MVEIPFNIWEKRKKGACWKFNRNLALQNSKHNSREPTRLKGQIPNSTMGPHTFLASWYKMAKKCLKIYESHSVLKDLDQKRLRIPLSKNMCLLWALWGLSAKFSWDQKTTEQETTLRFLCQKYHAEGCTKMIIFLKVKHTKNLLHLSTCIMRCGHFFHRPPSPQTAGPDLHVTLEPMSRTTAGVVFYWDAVLEVSII